MSNQAYTQIAPAIEAALNQDLKPLVAAIDQEGFYPKDFIHQLGKLGGYASVVTPEFGGLGLSLAEQIQATSQVAETCGSTGFVVWCQAVSAWYLHNTNNAHLKTHFLPAVAKGERLCGTAMSNTVKHLAGIERINLKAELTENGNYQLSGTLPWVSNLQENQWVIAAAEVSTGGYIMFLAEINAPEVRLNACPNFAGMQGTATYSLRFSQAEIPANQLLAEPANFAAFIERIKPGFILSQLGMGLGIINASLASIAASNKTHSHVNQFLPVQLDELAKQTTALTQQGLQLAKEATQGKVDLLEVLKLRAKAAELCLAVTQAEALHTGARGYLMNHGAQRRQREAMFVAIVTPALKHLYKEIAGLQSLAKAS